MAKQTKKHEPQVFQPPPEQRPPTHAEIEGRAYAIFLNRGSVNGHDFDDWLQAERELMQEQ